MNDGNIQSALRYLTIPVDIDVSGCADIGTKDQRVGFGRFYRELVLRYVPWGTAAEQDILDALMRLMDAKAGDVLELREAEHATLVAAMATARAPMTPATFLTFGPFFSAVARAGVMPPAQAAAAP